MAKPPSDNHDPPRYRIPQKAYDMAINVPMEIAGDYDLDPKVRLSAVKEIRETIDHYYEIECFHEDRQAAQDSDKPNTVIVVEDEHFFDNDAHAQAKISPQNDSYPHPGQPGDPPS